MTLSERLDEILARCEAATEGEWYWDPKGANWLMSPSKTILSASHDNNFVSDVSIKKENANFIAHARTDLPLVVQALKKSNKELESLRAENKKLKERIESLVANDLAEAREILVVARDMWNDPHYYPRLRELSQKFLEKTK